MNLTQRYGRDNPEIAKLWNYLYVAEGSDWEFQTELPWFVMQGLRYANAAETYVPTSTATATSTSTTSSLTYSAYLIPLVVVVIVVVAVVSFAALRSRRRR